MNSCNKLSMISKTISRARFTVPFFTALFSLFVMTLTFSVEAKKLRWAHTPKCYCECHEKEESCRTSRRSSRSRKHRHIVQEEIASASEQEEETSEIEMPEPEFIMSESEPMSFEAESIEEEDDEDDTLDSSDDIFFDIPNEPSPALSLPEEPLSLSEEAPEQEQKCEVIFGKMYCPDDSEPTEEELDAEIVEIRKNLQDIKQKYTPEELTRILEAADEMDNLAIAQKKYEMAKKELHDFDPELARTMYPEEGPEKMDMENSSPDFSYSMPEEEMGKKEWEYTSSNVAQKEEPIEDSSALICPDPLVIPNLCSDIEKLEQELAEAAEAIEGQ